MYSYVWNDPAAQRIVTGMLWLVWSCSAVCFFCPNVIRCYAVKDIVMVGGIMLWFNLGGWFLCVIWSAMMFENFYAIPCVCVCVQSGKWKFSVGFKRNMNQKEFFCYFCDWKINVNMCYCWNCWLKYIEVLWLFSRSPSGF